MLTILARIKQSIALHGTFEFPEHFSSKGYLKEHHRGHYLHDLDLGLGSQKFYLLKLPQAKTALDEIFDMKKVRNIADIEQKLLNDKFGMRSNYKENFKEFCKKDEKCPMALGFIRLGSQNTALVLNDKLKESLEITTSGGFYIAPLPANGALLISKKELAADCLKMVAHQNKDRIWCSNEKKKEAILTILGLELPDYYRVVFTDVTIKNDADGIPHAIINTRNEKCTFVGDMCDEDPYEISDLFDNRAYLLGE